MRSYLELEGRPYVEGRNDCYGLARLYYWKNYQLRLENYARPSGFAYHKLDIINQHLEAEGFSYVDAPLDRLEVGDGIIMGLGKAPLANHIGVYVGNRMFLHHLFGQKSIAENFGDRWKSRVLNIVRHPKVTEQNTMAPDSVTRIVLPYATL
jgi:cell wall-associated NlpC family hydrolase